MTAELCPTSIDASAAPLIEQSGRRGASAPTASGSRLAPALPDASARTTARGPGERPGPEVAERRGRRRRLRSVEREADAAAHRAEVTERLFRAGLHHLR